MATHPTRSRPTPIAAAVPDHIAPRPADFTSRRRRTPAPRPSRAELAAEFEALPDTAYTDTRHCAAWANNSESWWERDRWRGGGVPYVTISKAVRYRVGDIRAMMAARIRRSTSDPGVTT